MKKILIWGGTGQIGTHLIRKLTQNNYTVTVVTRNIHQKGHIIKTQGNAGYIEIKECSIFDENKVRIQKVPCIGRCANAPAAQVGKRAVNNATPLKLVKFSKEDIAPEIPDYQNLND